MNCGPPDHLVPAACFLDLNWDRPGVGPTDTGISPESQYIGNQPVRQLAPFAADPGFVERAARNSCFGGGGVNYRGIAPQLAPLEGMKMSRVSSCRSLLGEDSSAGVSDPISPGESNGRKRRAATKGKSKDTSKIGDLNAKRCRSGESGKSEDDEIKPKIEHHGGASISGGEGKEGNVKPPEPIKDYIHVRARRGQATDSHSLAERVRREKISERMKLLQDLVPGCNKVTGKALMLDEIINYVQSLQRQVEFLSMKLATVNPRLDFDPDSMILKDIHQSSGSMPHSVNQLAPSSSYANQSLVTNGLESQFLLHNLDPALHHTLSMQLQSLGEFNEAASQSESFWENDLHNVVQMGFGQGQETVFASQNYHDQTPADQMKIEL